VEIISVRAVSASAPVDDKELERLRVCPTDVLPGVAGIMYASVNVSERAMPSWPRNFSRRRHRISLSERSSSPRRRMMEFLCAALMTSGDGAEDDEVVVVERVDLAE
jgi:translation initiation factor 2 beta subunit (eIF-2beta)/eIF-5